MKTNTFVNSGFQRLSLRILVEKNLSKLNKFLFDQANSSCRGKLSTEQTRNDLDKKDKPVKLGNILNKAE